MDESIQEIDIEPEKQDEELGSKIAITDFFIGSLHANDEAFILTSESSPSFRLLAKPCIDIAIELSDIRSMTHTFSDEGVRVWMKDEGMIKMKQSLEQWDHNLTNKNKGSQNLLIKFPYLSDYQVNYLQNFFSSVMPKTLDEEMVSDPDDQKNGKSREARKKKLYQSDAENSEPSTKRPRKKDKVVDLCSPNAQYAEKERAQAQKRTLRNRRAGSKKPETIVIDEDYKDREQREVEEAIKRSLKTAGGVSAKLSSKEKEVEKVDPYAHIDKTIELFSYPLIQQIGKEVVVKMEDYLCLGKSEYLSDVIIDFYFSYIFNEKFTPEMREKVYVFPSQFYSIYATSAGYANWSEGENAHKPAAQKRYERVEGMLDPNVNYFEKDFLVFPLFENNHWFLSIVCYPRLNQNLIFADDTPTDDTEKRSSRRQNDTSYNPTPLKTSCILSFDSVKSNGTRRATAARHIKAFITSLYERKYKDLYPLGTLNPSSVLCPLQTNSVDCGCFIIEFFDRFFVTDPFNDFRLPIFKKDWFKSEAVRIGKRREIVEVIKQLTKMSAVIENSGEIELPELQFSSEQLDVSVVEINDENGNGNDENDENNGNNNNDEEFNNNNDFNFVNSNQVVSVSSSEIIPDPPKFDPLEEEEPFDVILKTSFRNLLTKDNDDTKMEEDDACNFNENPTDEILPEMKDEGCGDELSSNEESNHSLDNDVDMKDVNEEPLGEEIDNKVLVSSEQTDNKPSEENVVRAVEPVEIKPEKCNATLKQPEEIQAEECETTLKEPVEIDEIQEAPLDIKIEESAEIEPQPTESIQLQKMETTRVQETSLASEESPAVPVENPLTPVKEESPIPENSPSDDVAACKKPDDTCDTDSIVISD